MLGEEELGAVFHQEKKGPDGDAGNVDATEDKGLRIQWAHSDGLAAAMDSFGDGRFPAALFQRAAVGRTTAT